MKKTFIAVFIGSMVGISLTMTGIAIAQQQEQKEKEFTIKMKLSEVNLVLTVIDQSAASHQNVKYAYELIASQAQEQLKADSVKPKK